MLRSRRLRAGLRWAVNGKIRRISNAGGLEVAQPAVAAVKAKGSLNALEAVSIHVIPIIPVAASFLSVEVPTRLE